MHENGVQLAAGGTTTIRAEGFDREALLRGAGSEYSGDQKTVTPSDFFLAIRIDTLVLTVEFDGFSDDADFASAIIDEGLDTVFFTRDETIEAYHAGGFRFIPGSGIGEELVFSVILSPSFSEVDITGRKTDMIKGGSRAT